METYQDLEGNINKKAMGLKPRGFLVFLVAFNILSGAIASAFGVFSSAGNAPAQVVNSHGDVIALWGRGIYAHDSLFRAPIFIGTDLTILAVVIPLMIFLLIAYIKRPGLKQMILLAGLLVVQVYYGASISFGIQYNNLHLLYILFFSSGIFATSFLLLQIKTYLPQGLPAGFPLRSSRIFLLLTGMALFAAWLPDILTAMSQGRALLMIEHYTTEITYIIDMGIVAPLCFLAWYLLGKRKGQGMLLLVLLLVLCIIIGLMLPVQSFYQLNAGIELPIPVLLSKVASFVLLAAFAIYLLTRTFRSFNNTY